MRCAVHADVTTKDLVNRQVWGDDPPCAARGRRSPSNLMRSWVSVCCAPVARKSIAELRTPLPESPDEEICCPV